MKSITDVLNMGMGAKEWEKCKQHNLGLAMACDPFGVLLNSVCSYFVEGLCTHVQQGYWHE